MIYKEIKFSELSKVSGGWAPSPWSIAWTTGKVAYSAWKHRRSYWAGYKASPFH